MKTNRREFMGAMGLASLSLAFTNHVPETPLDEWEAVRAAFPLQHSRAYFNNGTFGPSPAIVLQTINEKLAASNTTGEYGHTDEYRKKLAEFIGVKTNELSLTHNTTEGINIACRGLALKAGDEVIISLHEHVGNALPWLNRAKQDGLKLVTFEPQNTAEANFDVIKSFISAKTRVIAIPHITCTTGLVFPVKEIAAMAKKKGIITAIDGAHAPGTFDLDLKDIGVDFYASSCHKWMLGPNGTGFLYISEEHLPSHKPIFVGAYSDESWTLTPPELKAYNPTAHRFDYGSQSMPMYAGAAAAADFHTGLGKKKIEARIMELSTYFYEGMAEMKSTYDILTPAELSSRAGMTTIKHKTKEYRALANAVSKDGFRIRVVPEAGLEAIRISTHIYNSFEEIDGLLKSLERNG